MSGSVGWWGLLTGSRCRSNCSGVKKKSCYFLAWGTQELRQELYGAKDGCLIFVSCYGSISFVEG